MAVQLPADATTSAASAPSVVTEKSCAGSQAGKTSRLQGATPTSKVAAPAGTARTDPAAASTADTSVETGERNMGGSLTFMFN